MLALTYGESQSPLLTDPEYQAACTWSGARNQVLLPGKAGTEALSIEANQFLRTAHTMYQGHKIGTELLASRLANDPAREIVMDLANQPAGDLVIGVAECPACGGELVRDQIN